VKVEGTTSRIVFFSMLQIFCPHNNYMCVLDAAYLEGLPGALFVYYMYVPMNQGFHILIMLCMSDLHIGHRVDLFAAFIPAVHPEHNAK
jgi:hypothetical protein